MGKSILVIEDETFLRELYISLLEEEEGYTVSSAENGLEGLVLAVNNSYDLIWSDIMLPIIDGLSALEHINKLGIILSKFVFVNNLGQDEVIKKAFNLGADAYWINSAHTPDQLKTFATELINDTSAIDRSQINELTNLPSNKTYKELRPKILKFTSLKELEMIEAKLKIQI
ncbi:hypothetical protein CO180_02640 [candidate division WWE3 bacterium CG_4_9_14_3_um_filter_41_6]|uniref:Response regulatory domain-containing protein n=1 Tax=candidate division WWE3 bacterium CG_4_10_14_0_2_um_filter_41_14 TaxID=1975072 RepID=A0A2M7TGJ6_UNCKA|nr:MAG: hypothetical protein COY32_05450 [candidate division WWE3 bacterium CG_4_10_14_0_2_um_filter_41_14]PJA38750.1 MAG: hypothetical protein CO180_02640 [candidate division WWE3 bacterium CG_4_9_14_3_um_filter_41_6]